MARIDRYMLSQLLVMFGFFALVLVALFWINRAVVLFDRLIGDGQSALVFLEFTALGLPKLIVTVLPIATFAASVYVTNRMSGESELTVLQAAGAGPWRLAWPVFVFGLCVAVMMTVLSHFLVPMAQGQLKQREAEISRNLTARLLTEGTFLHPSDDVTFYTRAIDNDGVLRDVFLSDRRKADEGVIYTAAEAYLARNGDSTTLIMLSGMAQRLDTERNRLATAKFRDFSFDISPLVSSGDAIDPSVSAMVTPDLLWNWGEVAAQTDTTAGVVAEELHGRFAQPLFCLVAAMIGFATLILGGFSRFGVWREAVIAFGLLIAIDGLRGTMVVQIRETAALWPLAYLPSLIGAVLTLAMLWQAAHPRWIRRRLRGKGAAA
ncbi:LPS export ABC transporter permease LptF [Sulfitobacter sp. HI0082]|uniref:LPS export ABC transporter permease LptF n=1 Tax=uncultured Sulfitobacter sp. TaxID=191468 RepID=UPI0007CFE18A|nr:LPS export ABC transporter permease LptF [Sulfitobacter sp. HI0082]MBD81908.1 LPS export ABC transporter permease LptF [Sulfitobacter sp.]HAC50336.1 LPS export ABC transporter permease LptF [Sulfitobacter sp.]HIF78942.1 LPS export ABC transporter permease LptF [Sulfitobacter sp.]